MHLNVNYIGIIQILLIVLKLFEITAVATWSWWVVLIPTLAVVAIWFFFLAIFFLGFLLKVFLD